MIATTLVAVIAVTAPTVHKILPEHRVQMFWIMTVIAGASARWVGWRLCWPPGSVGRHSVAFFFAATGCAAIIIVLNHDESWPRLMEDIPNGLGASALLGAVFVAAFIESGFWLFSRFWAAIIESGSLHTKTEGEQADEREPE